MELRYDEETKRNEEVNEKIKKAMIGVIILATIGIGLAAILEKGRDEIESMDEEK